MKLLTAIALVLALVQSAPAQTATPAELEALLARYDALPAGADKDAMERAIDACAGQKYAVYSRLFWYRDRGEAEVAARAANKPILSLRMLGRLDEDFSCANSRFFRVALYADRELSQFLRDNFVLHWSSERPVPRVTIDFGDGRKLHTTLAGNSAHYVLDCDGRPIDVLPGLYSADVFRRELEFILPLARSSPKLTEGQRAEEITQMHEIHDDSFNPALPYVGLNKPVRVPSNAPGIIEAEKLTAGKHLAQIPLLSAVFPSKGVHFAEEINLDASSTALFERLAPRTLTRTQLDAMRVGFERAIAADTQINEHNLRPYIHSLMSSDGSMLAFEALNEAVYRDVFRTPRSDPWLGLDRPYVFDGLPRD